MSSSSLSETAGMPTWTPQITEDVALALSDLQRESRGVGELSFREGEHRARRAEAEARKDVEAWIVAALQSAYNQGLAASRSEGQEDRTAIAIAELLANADDYGWSSDGHFSASMCAGKARTLCVLIDAVGVRTAVAQPETET